MINKNYYLKKLIFVYFINKVITMSGSLHYMIYLN